ncbi:MAG: hypothetical protein APF76_12545 [Desulfitibacter sp. BRH_c19]|nr:MAG: hypothetical protein APF76_12545 [Desulfitibacter sp. BRH_c19]
MIKLMLVDDHEVVRMGLVSLFELYPNFKVVGQASTEEEAVSKAMELKPDLIIMDVKLAILGQAKHNNGISACREIKEILPDTKIIMLSSFADDELIYESILAGASGYLLKGVDSKELITSIEKAAQGKAILDPDITDKVFKSMRKISKQHIILNELTNQEKEVLKLLSLGKSNKEIALEMVLSEKTIRNYVSQILAKLEVSNRFEAANYAVKNKLFDFDKDMS